MACSDVTVSITTWYRSDMTYMCEEGAESPSALIEGTFMQDNDPKTDVLHLSVCVESGRCDITTVGRKTGRLKLAPGTRRGAPSA